MTAICFEISAPLSPLPLVQIRERAECCRQWNRVRSARILLGRDFVKVKGHGTGMAADQFGAAGLARRRQRV